MLEQAEEHLRKAKEHLNAAMDELYELCEHRTYDEDIEPHLNRASDDIEQVRDYCQLWKQAREKE